MSESSRGGLHFFLVAMLLAVFAFVLGLWDVMVQRQGGDWLMQVLLPILIIIVLAVLHSQARRQRIAQESEEAETEERES